MIAPSILLLGPSGAGKSTFLRAALLAEGSGVVILAPGVDEWTSYSDLDDGSPNIVEVDGVQRLNAEKPYIFLACDDDDFAPSLDLWSARGLAKAVACARLTYSTVKALRDEGKPSPWALLGNDTLSGVGTLAYNRQLAALKRFSPPQARGDDGATFYGGYKNSVEEFLRACRRNRELGLTLVALSHVQEREVSGTSTAAPDASAKQHMPAFSGAVRESVPPAFDLVMFAGMAKAQNGSIVYYLQPRSDPKRVTKSRYGALLRPGETWLRNDDWSGLRERMREAEEARMQA